MNFQDDGHFSSDEAIIVAIPLIRHRLSVLESAREKTEDILEKIVDTQKSLEIQTATLAESALNLSESLNKLQKESSLQTKILSAIVTALIGILTATIAAKLQGG